MSGHGWLSRLISRVVTAAQLQLASARSAPKALVGGAKLELAAGLIERAVDPGARAAAIEQLLAFPDSLLNRAARLPVQLWLLEPGERVDNCALLPTAARAQRWLNGEVGLEDCAGLTVRLGHGLLVIAPWHRPGVLRHELGHALGALLTRAQRLELGRCFRVARADRRLLVPLAGRSVGEYLACGLAYYVQPGNVRLLRSVDPPLAALFDGLWQPRPKGK